MRQLKERPSLPRRIPAMQHSLLPRLRTAFAACLIAAFAASCATAPSPDDAPPSVARAELLLKQNNPAAAARMYEQLAAGNPPPARIDLALAAARAWVAANRATDAARVLDANSNGLSAAQQFERELIRGEVAAASGQYAPAWQQVSKIPTPVRPADASRLFLLQQQVALRAGQPVDGVRAGIERERVATSDTERARARRDLLTDLRSAIDSGLRVDPAAARDELVRGWLEIGQIAASATRSPLSAPAALERWRGRYPGHPATTIAASEIIAPGERTASLNSATTQSSSLQSISIALLLPLASNQSQVATAARLIRDGFMAAVTRQPQAGRPTVRIYDTAALTVPTALKNARADGADMVVGPLTKPEVQAANDERTGNLPMLLLNNLSGNAATGANIYQYALAPEDEARQIARQMVTSGKRNALVLTPSNDWGTRVAAAFTDELTRGGGLVVVHTTYDMNSSDPTPRVTAALGIDDSNSRNDKLRSITGARFGFEPRPRPDIDAIFLAGYAPDTAGLLSPLRLIYPVLNRYADHLPTFMTQDGLEADINANRELVGMYLLDTPWSLDVTGPAAETRTATESAWRESGAKQSRYFAFGFDAANLALAIRPGTAWPLAGLTGRLSLTPEGRVERNLQWARITSTGQVQPADPPAP
jgi:uncharacterized protein